MRMFLLGLTGAGWLLILATVVATVGFAAVYDEYGGNHPGGLWYIPGRPRWGRSDYALLAAFPLLFFLAVGYLLERAGVAIRRSSGRGGRTPG